MLQQHSYPTQWGWKKLKGVCVCFCCRNNGCDAQLMPRCRKSWQQEAMVLSFTLAHTHTKIQTHAHTHTINSNNNKKKKTSLWRKESFWGLFFRLVQLSSGWDCLQASSRDRELHCDWLQMHSSVTRDAGCSTMPCTHTHINILSSSYSSCNYAFLWRYNH